MSLRNIKMAPYKEVKNKKTCCHVQAFGHRVGRVPVGIQVTKPVLGFATVDSNILATLHFLPAVIFIFEMKFI